MPVAKLPLSFDADLAEQARMAARRVGRSVSSLIAQMTAEGLRRRALREAVESYEAEEGAITGAEAQIAWSTRRARHYGQT